MAKVAKKTLWWASVSDAKSYNVRIIPQGQPFKYEIDPKAFVTHETTLAEHEADLHNVALKEGVYDIYVTAQDAGGNESDPLLFKDSVLDFTPPASPSAGGFR